MYLEIMNESDLENHPFIDENSSNYDIEFSSVDHIEKICSTVKVEGQYFIYFYSDTCTECIEIKDDMITFATSNQNGYTVYFMNVDKDLENGFKEFADQLTNFQHIPAIVLIDDHQIKDEILSGEIQSFLDDMKNNEYLID